MSRPGPYAMRQRLFFPDHVSGRECQTIRDTTAMKIGFTILLLLAGTTQILADDSPVIEGMREYMEFAEYSDGTISAEQIASAEASDFLFIDVCNPGRGGG